MRKPKKAYMEFSPERDGSVGFMDEYTRQMNNLAEGIAWGRTPRPLAAEKSRPLGERPRREHR